MKTAVIEQLIELQETVIKDIKTAMNERNTAADLDEDSTRDADDFAQQEINKDFARKFVEQLEIAEEELKDLKHFKFQKNEIVEPGALIETEDFYILVGASVLNSTFNNKKVVCMSENAPAFELNKGKKANEELQLGNNKKEILGIY